MDDFQKTVATYLAKNPENKVKLARHCKTAVGTVTRWANGYSAPAKVAQPRIIEFIQSELRKGD